MSRLSRIKKNRHQNGANDCLSPNFIAYLENMQLMNLLSKQIHTQSKNR